MTYSTISSRASTAWSLNSYRSPQTSSTTLGLSFITANKFTLPFRARRSATAATPTSSVSNPSRYSFTASSPARGSSSSIVATSRSSPESPNASIIQPMQSFTENVRIATHPETAANTGVA